MYSVNGPWWIITINRKHYAHAGYADGVISGAIRRYEGSKGLPGSMELNIHAYRLTKEEKKKYKSFAAFRRTIEKDSAGVA